MEITQEFALERIVRVTNNPLENRTIEIDEKILRGSFNELTKGCNADKMALLSRADVYYAVKRGDKKFIKSIRKDTKESWVVLNPIHNYKGSQFADIVHYEGSKVINPVICKDLFVPIWNKVSLYDVLEIQEGLVYFQVCEGTKDNAKAIKKAYHELTGLKADEIFIYTPDAESRIQRPKRASGFGYINGEFHVDGYGYLNFSGRSRGVRISVTKKISTGNKKWIQNKN